jgi:hypothetical protein
MESAARATARLGLSAAIFGGAIFGWALAGGMWASGAEATAEEPAAKAVEKTAQPNPHAGDKLIAHEWGTFTCLQDDDGRELAGINIDDEPVPNFVHNLHPFLNGGAILTNEFWEYRQKGAPAHHPLVTMRLETPVIYFYPPKGQTAPQTINVDVRFRGGWITEYYPEGKVDAPGLHEQNFTFTDLTPKTLGSLAWTDLRVGTDGEGPKTYDHVWTAPRQTQSVNVTTSKGESEKYLFYRGVGNLKAPLKIIRGEKRDQLKVFSNFDQMLEKHGTLTIPKLWLADIRPGKTKFRTFGPIEIKSDSFDQIATLDGRLDGGQQGLDELKKDMHKSLVAAGLFEDEAAAMLATWDRAYFQSAGMRLFFVVPRAWTDRVLPLSISTPADIQRVMVARIELITEDQQKTLAELKKTKPSDGRWLANIPKGPAADKFFAGRADFGDLGVTIPADFQMYLNLGRFRNALVTAEERRQPTANLSNFIDTYGLQPFRLPEPPRTPIAGQH